MRYDKIYKGWSHTPSLSYNFSKLKYSIYICYITSHYNTINDITELKAYCLTEILCFP